MYLSKTREELMKVKDYGVNYPYLSREERNALHNLSHDDSIIIKFADKSSRIVNCDRVDYLLECQRDLSDAEIYGKVESSLLEKVSKRINSNFTKMVLNKDIESKVMEYLLIKRPQFRRLYLLHKINKLKLMYQVGQLYRTIRKRPKIFIHF